MSGTKPELRKSLIARRRSLHPAERERATRRIASIVSALRQFKPGARIAIYASFGSELNTQRVLQAAKSRGIALYVPAIVDLPRRRMRFVALGRTRVDVRNRRFIPPRWFNLILLPIVGIDAGGHRLGMGAGFYDRALAFRRLRNRWMGPRLIGLGFECQRVDSVHADHWDARLDALITESGLHVFPHR